MKGWVDRLAGWLAGRGVEHRPMRVTILTERPSVLTSRVCPTCGQPDLHLHVPPRAVMHVKPPPTDVDPPDDQGDTP